MEDTMGTGDIVIGLLAALGIVILIVVFFVVVRSIFFDKEKE